MARAKSWSTHGRLCAVTLATISALGCGGGAEHPAAALEATASASLAGGGASDTAAALAASSAAAPGGPLEADARVLAVTAGLLPNFVLRGIDLRMQLRDRMHHHGVPAVGLAVIEGGELAWARTWGVRQLGEPAAVDGDTAFQVASLSKPVTALAVLRLLEQGKLDLDADVNRYLASWKMPPSHDAKPITLRRLLSHTAGVNAPEQSAYFAWDGSFTPGYAPGGALPTTTQILDGTPPAISGPVALLDGPPAGFHYSGGGYTVVQQVIEDVTGEPFEAALERLVLHPLGMDHSTFAAVPPTDDLARAHDREGAVPPGGWVTVAEKAAGGLWSTPGDLARLTVDLMAAWKGASGRLLRPETVRLMLTPIASAKPTHAGAMGLGMFVSDDGGELWFSHNGHNPGYHATLAAMPDGGRGVVVLMNREAGDGLLVELLNAVGVADDWPERSGMRPRSRDLATLPAAVLASWAGVYQHATPALRVELRVAGTDLFATVDGAAEVRVYPVADDVLLEPFAPFQLKLAPGGQSIAWAGVNAPVREAERVSR